jgi:hypothetical protein
MMGKHLSDKNNSESIFHSGHKPELVPSYVEDRQTTHTHCAGKGSFEIRQRSPIRVLCQLIPGQQRTFGLRMTPPEIGERILA